MCGSMADIQSAAAEIRRGKKEERRSKIETTGQKYIGHNKCNRTNAATFNYSALHFDNRGQWSPVLVQRSPWLYTLSAA